MCARRLPWPRSKRALADQDSASLEPGPHKPPWRQVAALGLCNAGHFYSICSIFSYVGFLAVDCKWAPDIDKAGFVAGLLPTCLMVGRLVTVVAWGMLADRLGTRLCLCVSMAAVCLGNLLFGLATSLYAAVAVRAVLLGAANGFSAVANMAAREIGGENGQADVFARMLTFGSVVQMAGPAIGGFTYGLVPSFPALPPSLIGAAIALAACVATAAWLPRHRVTQGAGANPQLSPSTADRTPSSDPVVMETAGGQEMAGMASKQPVWSILCRHPNLIVMVIRAGQGLVMFALFDIFPLWAISSRRAGGLAITEHALGTTLGVAGVLMSAQLRIACHGVHATNLGLTQPHMHGRMQLCAHTHTGVHSCAVSFTLSLLGPTVRRIGVRRSLVWSSLLTPLPMLAIPTMAILPGSVTLAGRIALSAILMAAVNNLALLGITAAASASNNCFACYPERVGALNGVTGFVETIGKLLGPAVGAPLYAWLINTAPAEGRPLPLSGAFLTFALLALLLVIVAIAAGLLPRTIDGSARAENSSTTITAAKAFPPSIELWEENGKASERVERGVAT